MNFRLLCVSWGTQQTTGVLLVVTRHRGAAQTTRGAFAKLFSLPFQPLADDPVPLAWGSQYTSGKLIRHIPGTHHDHHPLHH
jgi:hypothetical protein